MKALKSESLPTRVKEGIQPLVGMYVAARLKKMNLSEEEKQEWKRKQTERVEQGTTLYAKFRVGEGKLLGWNFYGGCGACNGTSTVCKTVLAPKKSEK